MKVGVVLINWNGGEFTIPCIESLKAAKVIPDRIVVVDNASSDGSPDRIAKTFPEVTVIRNRSNKGFAEGSNQGAKLLLDEAVNYIWLLNNDTLVDYNCLHYLLKAADEYPQVSCFTGKIFYDNSSNQIWYAGGYRHSLHLAPKHICDDSLGLNTVETSFVSGCCMFIPKWALVEYGGFCNAFIAYSEDGEWSWRVRQAGGKLLYAPQAVLWQRVSSSIKKNTGRKEDEGISARAYYLMVRNNLWTIRLHAVPVEKKFLALLINIGIAIKIIAISVWNGFPYKVPFVIKGLIHGLVKRVPRYYTFKTD